jgi:hypothetical protein
MTVGGLGEVRMIAGWAIVAPGILAAGEDDDSKCQE